MSTTESKKAREYRVMTKKWIEAGIVRCKFQHTDICFTSPSEIPLIAGDIIAIESYLAGGENLGQWSDNMKTKFADEIDDKARKLFILAEKNDWPAQFLHYLVSIKKIPRSLNIHEEYNNKGGLRDRLFEKQSLFSTKPIMYKNFDQEMLRSQMPLTSVKQNHAHNWDKDRKKELTFDVNIQAEYWDQNYRQESFIMTEFFNKPSNVSEALAGV